GPGTFAPPPRGAVQKRARRRPLGSLIREGRGSSLRRQIEAWLQHCPPFRRVVIADLVPAKPLRVPVGKDRGVTQRVPGNGAHLSVRDPELFRHADVLTERAPIPAVLSAAVVGAAEILRVPALAAAIPDDRFGQSDLIRRP